MQISFKEKKIVTTGIGCSLTKAFGNEALVAVLDIQKAAASAEQENVSAFVKSRKNIDLSVGLAYLNLTVIMKNVYSR